MWKLPASERMARWRAFRNYIDSLPLDQAIQETVEFWAKCPFTPFYLEYTDSDNWPDPWQLINENCYCDLAKCLGIVYTLYLTKHKSSIEFDLQVYREEGTLNTYNLVNLNQGKYVINLFDNEIVNNTSIDEKLTLLHSYNSTKLNLEKY